MEEKNADDSKSAKIIMSKYGSRETMSKDENRATLVSVCIRTTTKEKIKGAERGRNEIRIDKN
jgi:hypothetical protein